MPKKGGEKSGIAVWRRVGDALSRDIERGTYAPGDQLPPATELADLFGVNRITMRRALAHLQEQGILSMEQGRGTFVTAEPLSYRFGGRTYFEENILHNRRQPTRRLLKVSEAVAPPSVRERLELGKEERVAVVTMTSEADGVPVSYGTSYFVLKYLPNVGKAFEKAARAARDRRFSTLAVLKTLGVKDLRRKWIRLRSRLATADEIEHLGTSTDEHVVYTEVANVDEQQRLVVLGRTVYPASRVQFLMEL